MLYASADPSRITCALWHFRCWREHNKQSIANCILICDPLPFIQAYTKEQRCFVLYNILYSNNTIDNECVYGVKGAWEWALRFAEGGCKWLFPVDRLHWLPHSLGDCNKVRERNRQRQEWKDVFLRGLPLCISPPISFSLFPFSWFLSICAFLLLLTNEFLTVPWFSPLSLSYCWCL